jgi:hypothetical protein
MKHPTIDQLRQRLEEIEVLVRADANCNLAQLQVEIDTIAQQIDALKPRYGITAESGEILNSD